MCPKAAFTTTIPVEILLAAGITPLDLNNSFIGSDKAELYVEKAEIYGFPRNSCAWIKGLFSASEYLHSKKDIDLFVAVTEGDCSNARVLTEIIASEFNIKTYIFNYPYDRDFLKMENELEKFASFVGTTINKAENVRKKLSGVRSRLRELDEFSYKYPGLISGGENHLRLVSSSDFNGGDWEGFELELESFLQEKREKTASFTQNKKIKKLAYLGVPPIFDLYSFIEQKKGVVIYNEIQREFAMLGDFKNLAEQYLDYTYPYSSDFRFQKAIAQIKNRSVDGIVHYVQAFCHRQLEDILLRKMLKEENLNIPVMTLEGDKPLFELDGRIKTRIEAFLETI